jgi:hypothetical protein
LSRLRSATQSWTTRLIGLALLLAGAVAWSATTPAEAAEPAAAEIELTAVTVTDSGLALDGVVSNTGSTPLWHAEIILWRDPVPITSRQQLEDTLQIDPAAGSGSRLTSPSTVYQIVSGATDPLQPGQSQSFSLSASWGDLRLRGNDGVYLVGAHLVASPSPEPDGSLVVRARTLVVKPGKRAEESGLVWLSSQPALLYDDVLIDDHLAEEFAGRLSNLAQAAQQDHSLSWAIDPALYQTARVMAAGYQVVQAGQSRNGTGAAAAQAWLDLVDQLPVATGYRLLWNDPDLALGASTGDSRPISQAAAALAAHPELDRLAGLPLLARPGNGLADNAFLDYLAPAQPALVLAQATQAAELPAGRLLPTLVDAYPVGPGPDRADTTLQVHQRSLAETYLGAAPDCAAGDDRDGGVGACAVVRVLTSSADLFHWRAERPSWVDRVALAQLGQSPAKPWSPDFSLGAAAGPLTVENLRAADRMKAEYDAYGELIGQAERVERTVLEAQTAAWSQDWPSSAAALIHTQAVQERAQSLLQRAELVFASQVTLTSHATVFPVTIANSGSDPIHVRLAFTSSMPFRLSVPTTDLITVAPGDRQTVAVSPNVTNNGAVSITARLITDSGYLVAQADCVVTINQSGRLAWLIIGVSGAVLLIGTALRIKSIQRTRQRDQAAEAAPAETAGAEAELDEGLDRAEAELDEGLDPAEADSVEGVDRAEAEPAEGFDPAEADRTEEEHG